jgi:hypothetical protein
MTLCSTSYLYEDEVFDAEVRRYGALTLSCWNWNMCFSEALTLGKKLKKNLKVRWHDIVAGSIISPVAKHHTL